jgi:hypothetical protein
MRNVFRKRASEQTPLRLNELLGAERSAGSRNRELTLPDRSGINKGFGTSTWCKEKKFGSPLNICGYYESKKYCTNAEFDESLVAEHCGGTRTVFACDLINHCEIGRSRRKRFLPPSWELVQDCCCLRFSYFCQAIVFTEKPSHSIAISQSI